MIAVSVVYLILGMFLDPLGMILLTIPVFVPMFLALNLDLVWFGVLVVKYIGIGLLTPPVGLIMFAMMDIARISMLRFARETMPFLLALLLVLLLITYVPGIVLLLPRLAFPG